MKKNYFLLFTFFLLFNSNAQVIEFKSSRFLEVLLYSDTNSVIAKDYKGDLIKIDENGDKKIELSEALKVSELNISSFFLTDISGIENFINLKTLICSGNHLTSFNINSLKELKYLNCSGILVNSLDFTALKNLETLICTQTQLVSINVVGLSKLHHLYLYQNLLEDLNLSGLVSLKYIDCNFNNLKKIDVTGLTQLEELICNDNKIESVINLRDCHNLNRLWIQNNELISLDLSNCPKLSDLWADQNNLTSIDLTTPKNVLNASFGNNKLTSVNVDDFSNIEFIRLSDNKFTTIDLSKFTNLRSVECNNNKELIALYLKNGSNEGADIIGCSNLRYICNDDIKNSHLEWYINYYNYTNISLNSYCTFEPGGVFYTIQGKTTLDQNNNGCDSNDRKYSNLNFSINNDIQKGNFISDNSGNYELPLGEGTYTITPVLENPTYYTVTPESLNITFPGQSNPIIQDFCIIPNGSHQDLEISILSTTPARPGFDATYKIIFKNKGNQTLSGLVNLDFNDAVLDFISSVPIISSQAINKLTWDYENLQPFETREINVIVNVNSPMETPAVNINDRLSFNVIITPIANDEKPVDNSFALRQIVVGSYDPNDKTCLEGDIVTSALIGEYVHYLIRFENTGTYPAENIVIKDLIDVSKFNISTLVPYSSSHSYVTRISDDNKVEFIFEKINLPFDDANNDGYIAFKIKTLPTLNVGDSFTNEANIYFDYNFPIITNKAASIFKTLATQDFEFSNYFNVYPNPVKDILNISLKNDIEIQSISIYDILGQLIISVPNSKNVSKIDVSRLRTGNYLLKIKTVKGFSTVKFIKE